MSNAKDFLKSYYWELTLSKVRFSKFKDTHTENAPWNKTQALTKSMNVGIWVIGTSNQLFVRGSYAQINFF